MARGDVVGSAISFPIYYCATKEDYVATVLSSVPLNIEFRRSLVRGRWNDWLHLVRRLMDVQLSADEDTIS